MGIFLVYDDEEEEVDADGDKFYLSALISLVAASLPGGMDF